MILIIDYIYKFNKYYLPLLNIIRNINLNITSLKYLDFFYIISKNFINFI